MAGTGAGMNAAGQQIRTGYGQDVLHEIPNSIEALLPGPPPMSPSGYVLGSIEAVQRFVRWTHE